MIILLFYLQFNKIESVTYVFIIKCTMKCANKVTLIHFYFILLLLTAPKCITPKDSKRSLNFFSQESSVLEDNFNLSSELNGVFPLSQPSQTSEVSFNLGDNNETEVCYCI